MLFCRAPKKSPVTPQAGGATVIVQKEFEFGQRHLIPMLPFPARFVKRK